MREEGKNSVAIIDTASKNILRLPVAVDSAIMNPVSKVVALRAGNNLQIYNLEMKSKMKTTVMDHTVLFWKWLDAKTIAIVTDSAVYHWTMDADTQPTKIFDRAAYDGPVQIINYRASADQKWLLLGGIAASAVGGVVGVLQVYSVDLRASQPTMDAHAATFATVTIDGRETPSNLFCFTTKGAAGPRLNIIEVGVPKEQAFNRSAVMQYDEKDFPVSMIADNAHGSLFIITKAGLLFLYEIQSGKCIFAQKASANTMFASWSTRAGRAACWPWTRPGRVSHFFVDEKNIVSYVCNNLNDYDLGVQMAKRYNLPGAENLFKQQFQRLIQANRLDEAMELAAQSPQGILRNMETINLLKNMDGGKGLLQYFQMLLKRGKLNTIESIELSRLVLAKGGIEHIKGWLKDQKLEASEELGDLLRNHNVSASRSPSTCAPTCPRRSSAASCRWARRSRSRTRRWSTSATSWPTPPASTSTRTTRSSCSSWPASTATAPRTSRCCSSRTRRALSWTSTRPWTPSCTRATSSPPPTSCSSTSSPAATWRRTRLLQTRLLEINLLATPQVADAIMESGGVPLHPLRPPEDRAAV